MNGDKKQYDLICSLGGNCAAAHNLLIRNLRHSAYPFDWTYFKSDEAVYILAEGFKDGFKQYMLKENLTELPVNPSHPDRIQMKDEYGKIVWANHFSYKEDRNKNYADVKKKFDRRFKRLMDDIEKSKNILFLFSSDMYVKPDSFLDLSNTLKELYKDKNFQIRVVSFDCDKDDIFNNDSIQIFYFKRKINDYDFLKTNYEWEFLDKINLTKKYRQRIILKIFGYRVEIKWGK